MLQCGGNVLEYQAWLGENIRLGRGVVKTRVIDAIWGVFFFTITLGLGIAKMRDIDMKIAKYDPM